jgi:prepilin-type N-terminal cleavage/methylation domain-containing protein
MESLGQGEEVMKKRSERGFTLMELMVVIVIVAILAAVAVPLYINYVKDAQRTEAKGAIGAIISAEQIYYQKPENNSTYLDAGTTADIETKLRVDLTESKVNWDFELGPNDNGFTVKATGKTGRPSDGLTVTYKHNRVTPEVQPWDEK